jgi:DNA polymerase III subunit delta
MALFKRTEFLNLLDQDAHLPASQVYLIFGERYLCREIADRLQHRLLGDKPGAVQNIDGDTEDPGRTLARLMSYSLLPGRQLYRIGDSHILHSKSVAADIWRRAEQAFQSGRADHCRRHLQAVAQAVGLEGDSPAPFSSIPPEAWQKIFAFAKPQGNLDWADRLLSEAAPSVAPGGGDLAERFVAAFQRGLPGDNLLLLTTETVDKRQRLFTYLKNHQTVIDCSVATGATQAVQSEQKELIRELMQRTLAGFQKKIEPKAVEIFFERVGFHPVAVVVETEKLAHYSGDRPTITIADLQAMVANNREGALYELTDAFSRRQTAQALTVLSRLLDQGIHALAILATMRNFIRRQLIYRSIQLQPEPPWHHGMQAREFQNSYLPALKLDGRWKGVLDGHPYALYMNFSRAGGYSCAGLKRWLALLLETEFRLKGSPLPPRLVLEELFLRMLRGTPSLTRTKPGEGY